MDKVVCGELWGELKKVWRGKNKRAAVAYVSDDSGIRFDKGDVLVVDASDHCIRDGSTSAKVLRSAFHRGALLFHYPGLHAKIYHTGKGVLIGSANCTKNSRRNLTECAVLTDSVVMRGQAAALIEQLRRGSKTQIDKKFLERIEKIPVSRARNPVLRARKNAPQVRDVTAWILSALPWEPKRKPKTSKGDELVGAAKKEAGEIVQSTDTIETIRYTESHSVGKRLSPGDSFILIWSESAKATSVVYPPVTVIHKKVGNGCIVVCYEESDEYKESYIALSKFHKVCKQLGITNLPTRNSQRQIRPSSLMQEFERLWPRS